MDDLLKIVLGILTVIVITYVSFCAGYGQGMKTSYNKVMTGHKIEVKYQTNSLGEVTIVSRNWVKNEK